MLVGMLAFSGYGTLLPADLRCALPGAVGCPGGLLGPLPLAGNSSLEMFFNITMYDYGFWIVDTANGANETSGWYVYEGWTVHVNATSLPANPSVGGSAYHGIGVELNATGKQLLSLSAPVGRWVASSFTAPSSAYYRQHIWCTIECGSGHSGMQSHNFYVIPATFIPTVSASANETRGAPPLAVGFTGLVQGGTPPFTATWDFGDGSPVATTLNTTHTYTLAGTYAASLAVADSKGFSASGSVSITVTATAVLAIAVQASAASGYAPLLTTLSATVTGGSPPYAIGWSLGDGGSATGTSLTHLYTSPGEFTASATVSDAAGASATAQATVTVQASTGTFDVGASAAPSSGPAPLSAVLSATPRGGSAPYATAWAFGDGSFGSGAAASHTYALPGAYEAAVFVTDAAGRVGTNFTAVAVSGTTGSALAAHLVETPATGSPPLAVTASVSAVGGSGTYTALAWTFGDGTTGSGPVVVHEYTGLGTYSLTVRVTDSTGASATDSTTVLVEGVVVVVSVNRTAGDAPLTVGASASISGGTGIYRSVTWDWGDGSTSSGNPANHTYAANVTGTVTVQASATDSGGQSAVGAQAIAIAPSPVAVLAVTVPASASPPVAVNFTLEVTGGTGPFLSQPLWTFGDGTSTRAGATVNHTFSRPGHFEISVQTNDSVGTVVVGTAWVNLSTGGLAGGVGVGTGGPSWVFTGVDNPDEAALALMGLVAMSGLAMLYRTRRLRAARPSTAPRPARPGTPSVAPGPRSPAALPRPAPVDGTGLPPGWSPPPPPDAPRPPAGW
jgi:PKD repeat protein